MYFRCRNYDVQDLNLSIIFRFPIRTSLAFMFKKTPPGSCFQMVPVPMFVHCSMLVPFWIFGISKKASFGQTFAPNRSERSSTLILPRRTLTDPALPSAIVNTAPLGTTCFQSVDFGGKFSHFYYCSSLRDICLHHCLASFFIVLH